MKNNVLQGVAPPPNVRGGCDKSVTLFFNGHTRTEREFDLLLKIKENDVDLPPSFRLVPAD